MSESVSSNSAANLLSVLAGDDASDTDKALSASLVKFLRQKLSEEASSEREELSKRQALLLAAQKTKFEDEISKLEDDHGEELREMQEKLQEYHQAVADQKKQLAKLQQELEAQNKAVADSQKMFEQKLAKNKEADNGQIEVLKKSLAQDMQRKIEALAEEYSNELAAKEMDMAYRDEENQALQNEVERLNTEKSLLITHGGEQFLNRLKENKVSFVVYHQGPGHINIDIDHIGEYLTNPMAYAAKSVKVSEEIYRMWLKHHEDPVCQCFSEIKKEICGKKLKLVTSPSQFISGRSDRCPLHWSFVEGA